LSSISAYLARSSLNSGLWKIEDKSSFMVVIYLKGKIKNADYANCSVVRRNVFCQKNTLKIGKNKKNDNIFFQKET
jgi:hypothetical protein